MCPCGAQSREYVWWDLFRAAQVNFDVFQDCFEHVQSKIEHCQTHRVNFCALSLHFFAKQFQARVPGIEARIRGVQARIPEEPFLKKNMLGPILVRWREYMIIPLVNRKMDLDINHGPSILREFEVIDLAPFCCFLKKGFY